MDTLTCSDGDVLWDGAVVVSVVEAATPSNTKRTLSLFVKLETKSSASTKELVVRVTDETDPFVLYTCVVREEDYHSLRQQQGLLVDFSAFPHSFVDLVNSCTKECGKESPSFVLMLRSSGDSVILEVVEPNRLKNLCHLALTLTAAPTQLKLAYLADSCKALKAELAMREKTGSQREAKLHEELRQCRENLSAAIQEASHLRTEMKQQALENSDKQARLLTDEKEKLLQVQSDADRRVERERREMESRLSQQIDRLKEKVASLKQSNADLTEKKNLAETNAKEIAARLSATAEELERCHQDLRHRKKQNTRLEEENHIKTSSVRELESRLSEMERELKGRDASITHMKQVLETLQEQKSSLEETVKERGEKLAKRETSIQLLYADLQKSLQVIKKLQKRVKEESISGKVRGAALAEQDKVVMEKDTKISQLSEQVDALTTKTSCLTEERDCLQGELLAASEKIKEQEKTLQTNSEVITWLNTKITKAEAAAENSRRAPLTEAYMSTQRAPSSMNPGCHIMAHSTPLSNTTVSSGLPGLTHSSLNSIRNLRGIPPIPEEISPTNAHDSPAADHSSVSKEKSPAGLDPKYLEASRPGAVVVHGLLRANYDHTSQTSSTEKVAASRRGGQISNRGGTRRGRGLSGGRRTTSVGENKRSENQHKPTTIHQRSSNYFPVT